MQPCFLAVDIGASSGRHIVGTVQDGKITLQEVYRFENGVRRENGRLCWNIDALAAEVVNGLKAAHDAGYAPATIGIDTWAVDFVLLDADGQRIGDAVAYRDERTEGVREALEHDCGLTFAEHYARTGIQYQKFNTVYQLMALKKEHPEQLAAAKTFLMVPDYLNYLLEHDYPQQAKELASTLLVYGGKAQLYFGYRTDALAGTAEPNSTANWGSYQFESSGTQTDDYYGSSLLLEPVIQIRHYFMVPDGAECTFTFAWNAGEPETELQPVDTNTRFDGKEVYYVVTPAIAFRRADAMPVVAMRQNGADLCTLRYGVFSYGDMVRALAAVDESQLPLLNLLRALDDLTTAAQRYSVAG